MNLPSVLGNSQPKQTKAPHEVECFVDGLDILPAACKLSDAAPECKEVWKPKLHVEGGHSKIFDAICNGAGLL